MKIDPILRLVAAALLLLAPAVAVAQVLEEQDLQEPDIWARVKPLFAAAAEKFNSIDQLESVGLLERFLDTVAENRAFEEPSEDIVMLVREALFMKAQAGFNVGSEGVEADLRGILEIDPAFVMDRGLVSPKLVDLFDDIQRKSVGRVDVRVEPVEASVTSGRFRADDNGLLRLPIGLRTLRIERPGYTAQDLEIEVNADDTIAVDVSLERSAAVLTIFSRQPDVDIYIDNLFRGTTAPNDDRTNRIVLADLQVGRHTLEARKGGYRSYQSIADIQELIDYEPVRIELQRKAGTVLLQGYPAGTVIRVNDKIVPPEYNGGSDPHLTLDPGDYRLSLTHPSLGRFETEVRIADLEELNVTVKLRPALALVGILGTDETGAETLRRNLSSRLADLDRWSLVDRSHMGESILSQAQVTIEALRSYSQTQQRTSIDWSALQRAADEQASASLYILAVLSSDFLVETAEIFIFPRGGLPSLPDHFTLSIDGGMEGDEISALDGSILASRPSVGATIVDSAVNGRPVVIQVNEVGTAARAGLQPGDEILSLEQTEILSVAQLRRELAGRIESHAKTGLPIELSVLSAGQRRVVRLAIELSPRILSLRETEILYSAAATELAREATSTDREVPKWLVDLNQAVVFLRGKDLKGATDLLLGLERSTDSPLGFGMANYFLGLAARAAGPEFTENARSFLTRAAETTDARLYYEEGPFVSPRAKARLLDLN